MADFSHLLQELVELLETFLKRPSHGNLLLNLPVRIDLLTQLILEDDNISQEPFLVDTLKEYL